MAREARWDLYKIREALKLDRVAGTDSGAAFSWATMAEAIAHETGIRIPSKQLSKFAIGEPPRTQAERRAGARHFSRLQKPWLDAVVRYLSDPEGSGYVCPIDDLLDIPLGTLLPQRFAEFLETDVDGDRYFTARSVSGVYSSTRRTVDGTEAFTLRLKYIGAEFAMHAALETRNPAFLAEPTNYVGWAVISPEENISVFLEKGRTRENRLLLTVAVDAQDYFAETVHILVLLEHEAPDDTFRLPSVAGEAGFLDDLVTDLRQRVYVFHREP